MKRKVAVVVPANATQSAETTRQNLKPFDSTFKIGVTLEATL
jgi:hypothetical protein